MYWGMVEGKGDNFLGKILVSIRKEINDGSDWDRWVADQGVESNLKRRP